MAGAGILFELGLVIGVAAILALIMRIIKQPAIIAYLVAGILVGPMFLDILKSHELIEIFGSIGVTFLLFIVGLSLNFKVLRQVGRVSLIIGISQIIIIFTAGLLISLGLGFSITSSIFLAVALAFSSTLFVMNLLDDKKELDTLHGKIAIGTLIAQDFVAALALMMLPLVGSGAGIAIAASKLVAGLLAIIGVFLVSYILMPRILTLTAKDQETLFLFSIGWAMLVAILFQKIGLSVELGALIAGMSLASSRFSLEIGGKIGSLREFFVIIHLIFFGSLLVGPISTTTAIAAIIFSSLILIGNPIIVMSFMRFFGYKKRTGFLTGISIAQISEFSLILVFIGFTTGAVPQEILTLVILVALITIALSSYAIYYSKELYKLFAPILGSFDGRGHYNQAPMLKEKYDVILFGYNRIGYNLLKSLNKSNKRYLVVDYDPEIVERLKSRGLECVYGDATDVEFLKELNMRNAKIIISTIPDIKTNKTIYKNIPTKKAIFIPTSHEIDHAKELYEDGADYVIMPHFLGGHFMGSLLGRGDFDKNMLKKHTKRHMQELKEREYEGHTHPKKGRHGR